jgi:hypothetical protein
VRRPLVSLLRSGVRMRAVAASVVIGTSICAARAAAADPVSAPLDTSSAPAAPAADAGKSETSALAWSELGAIAGPVLVVGGGAWFAHTSGASQAVALGTVVTGVAAAVALPSVGHWYAGDRDVAQLLARGAGAMMMVGGFAGALEAPWSNNDPSGLVVAAIGAGIIVASSIYDIATAPRAARRYNSRRHLLIVTPALLPTDRGTASGFAIAGSF